jgi:hypothetical protein
LSGLAVESRGTPSLFGLLRILVNASESAFVNVNIGVGGRGGIRQLVVKHHFVFSREAP